MIINITKCLFIRKEINSNEKRVPIVPNDVKKLVENGFTVYIESSSNRIFKDIDYVDSGAFITNFYWYDKKFNNFLIIGIKELDCIEKLDSHTHLYFSHTYQNQLNSLEILKNFKKSSSVIYDFEYFYNYDGLNKQRIISFCFFAGFVGAFLGLKQYLLKKYGLSLTELTYYSSIDDMINHIKSLIDYNTIFDKFKQDLIGIIGPNGKTGLGAKYLLNLLKIPFKQIYRHTSKNDLDKYSILLNCIKLDPLQNETWFSYDKIYYKEIIIVDISCDYSKSNNPIKIYNDKTTWKNPIYKPNKFIDIIAIENLPSLLPLDSSIYFSNILTNTLLLDFNSKVWKYNYDKYYEIIENI